MSGRVCSIPGCGTILSAYNASRGGWCSIHERLNPPNSASALDSVKLNGMKEKNREKNDVAVYVLDHAWGTGVRALRRVEAEQL